MNVTELNRLQQTECEIIRIVADFCFENKIQYSLYAGTALGAVRHKGFIPWDDDVDIVMTRQNFIRFCALWKDHPVSGYTLSCLQYDDDCGTCHAKVHKDNTVLLSEGEEESIGNHGIWLDIFPLDKVSDKRNQRAVFHKAAELILLARANTVNYADGFSKKVIRKTITMLPRTIRRKRIHSILNWLAENDAKLLTNYKWVSLSATYAFKYRFSENMCDEVEKISFNNQKFDIFKEWHHMLTVIYGDYMKLPPEDERKCSHNPIKLKF